MGSHTPIASPHDPAYAYPHVAAASNTSTTRCDVILVQNARKGHTKVFKRRCGAAIAAKQRRRPRCTWKYFARWFACLTSLYRAVLCCAGMEWNNIQVDKKRVGMFEISIFLHTTRPLPAPIWAKNAVAAAAAAAAQDILSMRQ